MNLDLKMKVDLKNMMKKLGKLEDAVRQQIESGALLQEARRFADGQVKVLRKKVKTSKDAKKVLAFIEQRKKQIEKVAKDIPSEVKQIRTLVLAQRKELEKIGNNLIKRARAGEFNAEKIRSVIRAATTKKAAKAAPRTTTKKRVVKARAKRK
jgi:flagellar basal body rod protein FlgG